MRKYEGQREERRDRALERGKRNLAKRKKLREVRKGGGI